MRKKKKSSKRRNIAVRYTKDLRGYRAYLAETNRAREAAELSSQAKSAFLANMSHEIRTPMNSIIGFSELALDNDISPKIKDYLINILNSSEWLLQIVNDILDISKIESGKMELENIPFDLHDMFAHCRTVIMPKAMEKDLRVHFHAEPSIGKRLYGDPTRLRQVFLNLLTNAVKFTDSGIINMKAAVKEKSANSVTMYFEIKDSGIGIAEDQLEKIFDPFAQAETGTARKFGGSGLGLPITRNIIEMMGGTLCVDSAPGIGSKFSFELAFDACDISGEEDIAQRILFDNLEKPSFEGEILLFEDNAMNQQVICEHLARVGLKTVVAQNGKEGVEMIKKRALEGVKQFDLIFMDIYMPVMDGIEAASKIFELKTGIPIIVITANVMANDRDIYASIGMNDCISKPFTSQELWRCLMKYLKPVAWQKEEELQREFKDRDFYNKLINNFVKNSRDKYFEITDALNKGDVKLAHRLAHTLKSNAGQFKKTLLQQAAGEIEDNLRDGENHVCFKQLDALRKELNAVMAEFSGMTEKSTLPAADEPLDSVSARRVIDEVQSLLKDSDPECMSLVKYLKLMPESDLLIQQIEDFDFKSAMETLSELKKKVLG